MQFSRSNFFIGPYPPARGGSEWEVAGMGELIVIVRSAQVRARVEIIIIAEPNY